MKSPEPQGSEKQGTGNIFVVHEHNATHLHYDLRLQIGGVLRSWAIPKEPPEKEGIKRLAIQTEDHPLGYVNFEGKIPEGEYGAGKVEIWDKGTFELRKREEKEIVVTLHGEELKGDYVLIRTKYGKKGKGWLFFKRAD